MKTTFKRIGSMVIITGITIIGCHKDNTTPAVTNPASNPSATSEGYTSMSNFFAKNGVPMQTFTINGTTGGNFTSPQGTKVSIPANAFLNSLSQVVTGNVTINFKDIYNKSDMLLTNMATTTSTGAPLKSGGEFFIKATSSGSALTLAQTITVTQTLNSVPLDSFMLAFMGYPTGWVLDNADASVFATVNGYVYSLFSFSNPPDSGTWCNSDCPSYFSHYTLGTLILQETDTASNYNTYVYLVFKTISTTDACHTPSGNNFNYINCVPVGMQCTAVAVGIKNGTVYSSFIPITITSNQTITFSMSATTTPAFKAALTALN